MAQADESFTRIIPTPIKTPNANAYTERWVRTVRQECLDHILIVNDSHLLRVLGEFIVYYNARRPRQSLEQQSPIPRSIPMAMGTVNRREVLGMKKAGWN